MAGLVDKLELDIMIFLGSRYIIIYICHGKWKCAGPIAINNKIAPMGPDL